MTSILDCGWRVADSTRTPRGCLVVHKPHSPLRNMLACLILLVALPSVAFAQAKVPQPAPAAEAPANGFFDMIKAGGWVGHTILLLSVVAVSLSIEHLLTIRRATLLPAGLAEKVRDLLRAGRTAEAEQACKMQPSALGYVLQTGLAEVEGGWTIVEKAMEDAVAEQAARLYRKAEYISVIGNIAPMLGLLGTVIGMIEAFSEVAATQGTARAADLAEGIYLALVTTVEGLVVAIPALAVFAIFRSRIDGFVAEIAYVAQHVFAPLRRGTVPTRRPPAPPTVTGGPK
jgi:biopolymer transport protein ExbB